MLNFVDRIVVADGTAKAMLLKIWDEARQNGLDKESLEEYVDRLEKQQQSDYTVY